MKISNYARPGSAPTNGPATPGGTGGTLGSVTDGATTVSPANSIDFASGATVTDLGGGAAQVDLTAPAMALDDLTDVNAPSPADGDALVWDDYAGEWIAAAPSGVSDIVDIPTAETDTSLVLAPDGAGGVEWVTPGAGPGGGALVLLEQHTASSSATLDFTTAITATYDEYLIEVLNLLPATNQVDPQVLASTDGGSTWLGGTSYGYNQLRYTAGTGQQASNGTSAAIIDGWTGGLIGNTASYGGYSATIRLFSPGSTSAHKAMTVLAAFRAYDGTVCASNGSVLVLTTSAINALRFQMSSGNITSGTIRMYGVAKS